MVPQPTGDSQHARAAPRLNADPALLELVDALAANGEPGWLSTAVTLLEGSVMIQQQWAGQGLALARQSAQDGQPHCYTVIAGDKADTLLIWASQGPGQHGRPGRTGPARLSRGQNASKTSHPWGGDAVRYRGSVYQAHLRQPQSRPRPRLSRSWAVSRPIPPAGLTLGRGTWSCRAVFPRSGTSQRDSARSIAGRVRHRAGGVEVLAAPSGAAPAGPVSAAGCRHTRTATRHDASVAVPGRRGALSPQLSQQAG